MDFDIRDLLLIIHSALVKYLTKREYNSAVHLWFIGIKNAYESVKRKVLYNIPNEFGIPKKLLTLIKMCFQETNSIIQIQKHLSDTFPIILYYRCLSTSLEYAIRKVQANQEMKLNATYQLKCETDYSPTFSVKFQNA